MDTILRHTDGKVYLIETTPLNRIHAQVYELIPRKASGIVANFLEEVTGQEQYTYDQAIVAEDDLITLVMELGHKQFRSKAWKNLFDWAYFRTYRESLHLKEST